MLMWRHDLSSISFTAYVVTPLHTTVDLSEVWGCCSEQSISFSTHLSASWVDAARTFCPLAGNYGLV